MPIPNIVEGSITGINGIQMRPVYFLTIAPSASPNVVVKGEQGGASVPSRYGAAASIAWSSQLMGAVNDSRVMSVPMNGGEIEAFKNAARRRFPAGDARLLALDDRVLLWVKMPYVAGLSDADPTVENGRFRSENFKAARDAIGKLYNEHVWRDLGKVVAVDLFNGNNDRFNEDGGWENQGNIMFTVVPGAADLRVIGLDTYDPNSCFSRLTKSGVPPILRILRDGEVIARQEFAKKCVRSVGEVLSKSLEKTLNGQDHFAVETRKSDGSTEMQIIDLSEVEGLFEGFWDNFYQGLTLGAQELKVKLIAKVGPTAARPGLTRTVGVHNLAPMAAQAQRAPLIKHAARTDLVASAAQQVPQGITDRMRYLGW